MDANRFQQIGEWFDELIELTPAERAVLLQERCTDPVLRAEIEAMLLADVEGDSFEFRIQSARVQAMVAELPKKEAPAHDHGGGGMGGMGGMDF